MPNSPDRPRRSRGGVLGTLLRMREPIAWLVLVVTVAYLVLGGVRLGWSMTHESMSLSAAARQAGAAVPLVWALVDVTMVLVCIFGAAAIGRARALTRTAAVIMSVAACYDVLILAVGVLGAEAPVFSRVLETIGGLLEVAAKIAAAVVLWRLLAARADSGDRAVGDPVPAQGAVWAPEQATGRTWGRAADAATMVPGGPGHDPGEQGPQLEQDGGSGARGPSRPGGESEQDAPRPSVPWLTAGQLAAGQQPPDPQQTPRGWNSLRAE